MTLSDRVVTTIPNAFRLFVSFSATPTHENGTASDT